MTGTSIEQDWCESGVVALTGTRTAGALVPHGDAAAWARCASSLLGEWPEFAGKLDGAALLGERAALTGWTRNGKTSVGGHARLLSTADGWVALSCARPDDRALLGAMISEQVGEDPWPAIARWVRARERSEIDARIELLGVAGGCVDPAPAPPVELPSAFRSVGGATVVDFSALWAGPLCAQLLGMAGANVIKVETPQRPDGARFGNSRFYDLMHVGHESVVLDPKIGHERAWLARIVDSADIVIEASRPRALVGFGLDAHDFARRGRTWISITAYGRESNRIGFGDDVAAACGLVAADADGTPLFAGDAIADPLTGLRAALCALDSSNAAAGRVWDVSMAETVSSTIDSLLDGEPKYPGYPISEPRHRVVAGSAPRAGAHTAEVLRRIGVDV